MKILFSPKFPSAEYLLLELDKNTLETIQTGEILVFRGDEQDSAVLCTSSQTFQIKEAETSNSLLLFKDLEIPQIKSSRNSASTTPPKSANTLNCDGLDIENVTSVESRAIENVFHTYLEMKVIRPQLSKIHYLLRGTEYNGTKESKESSIITLDVLLEKVPASEAEITKYLQENMLLETDGKLRLVEDEYLFRIFSQVLNCIDANSWLPNEISKNVVINSLSSLAEPSFLEKIFQWFFVPVCEPGASSSKLKYTFREDNVCKFLGETLLKSMGKFNMKDFLKVWDQSVPEGLQVNLLQLSGVCVYDEDCSPPLIWYFPEHSLPETFPERLAVLFETKQRWKKDEITPFIQVFAPPNQNVGNLLTKYATSSNVNGTKYYSAKYGK